VVFAGEIAQLERQRRDPVEQIARERLERVSRMYRSNKEAAQALGIALGSFGRARRRYGIETPYVPKRKRRESLE
jgi:hypothetical protein